MFTVLVTASKHKKSKQVLRTADNYTKAYETISEAPKGAQTFYNILIGEVNRAKLMHVKTGRHSLGRKSSGTVFTKI